MLVQPKQNQIFGCSSPVIADMTHLVGDRVCGHINGRTAGRHGPTAVSEATGYYVDVMSQLL